MATPTRPAAKKSTAKPTGTTTSGVKAQGKATQKSLEQHLSTLAEGEVLDPQGLYEFCDALRAVSTGISFFVHAAAGQLDHAVRKGARDNADGRLTMAQKAKLKMVLRRIARQLDSGSAEDLLSAHLRELRRGLRLRLGPLIFRNRRHSIGHGAS